jgi:hypothetical protein
MSAAAVMRGSSPRVRDVDRAGERFAPRAEAERERGVRVAELRAAALRVRDTERVAVPRFGDAFLVFADAFFCVRAAGMRIPWCDQASDRYPGADQPLWPDDSTVENT